jgi:asparagine synthase (glutamine-hydrolysing)
MGAISFVFYNMKNPPVNIDLSKAFLRMKTRGEDDTQIGIESTPTITSFNKNQISNYLSRREIAEYRQITFHYGYHRLSINDISLDGSQPFEDPIVHKSMKYPELRSRLKRRLLCNGEIYNYNDLVNTCQFSDRDLQSQNDVEVILPLYIRNFEQSKGNSTTAFINTLKQLDGDYSFVLMENTNSFSLKDINIFVARDPFGVKPLYMVKYIPSKNESNMNDVFYMFVSELKGIPLNILNDPEYIISEVPPGTFWSYNNSIVNKNTDDFIRYYDFSPYKSLEYCTIKTAKPETINALYDNTKKLLTESIIKRYELSHQSIGILLSGGFDSCIILSILVDYLVKQYSYKYPLHVFTIGDSNNIDVNNAILHVQNLENTYTIDIHHHIIRIDDVNLMLNDIPSLVVQLETYDSTTIKKSLPMSFLLKYIKTYTDIKVLLTGDGLDELCGYDELFLLEDDLFQKKSVELLENISKYDLLRCDKIAGLYGLELRYPFLDKSFVEYFLKIHPMLKRPQMSGHSSNTIEKYIIRKAFDTDTSIVIDKEILWNQRQDIIDSFDTFKNTLNDYFDNLYTDLDFSSYIDSLHLSTNLTRLIPQNKEEMYYKKIFDKYYPYTSNILEKYWNLIWE